MKQLKDRILAMPAQIRAQSKKLYAHTLAAENKNLIVNDIKERLRLEISSAQDREKVKYSNEDQRRAALATKLASDTEYQAVVAELTREERLQKNAEIELQFLRDTFNALRTTAMLIASGQEDELFDAEVLY